MQREDLDNSEAKKLIKELNELIIILKSRGMKISSWYGCFDIKGKPGTFEVINRGYKYKPLKDVVDDLNFPWFLYWEICWIVMNNNFIPGQKVIDLGGSSSLFSYYLAYKGLEVITVELNQELVENANVTASEMNWNLQNLNLDMTQIDFNAKFDHITSICVYEHIPISDRVKINQKIKNHLKPGGKFSITFDYRNPSKKALINTPEDVYHQFIEPSDLQIRGNEHFVDTGENYLLHPFYVEPLHERIKNQQIQAGCFDQEEYHVTKHENDYTFGALFLEKPVCTP
jgi:2-polyprenyl-3-methyl-5-hydroxy-6-metoxy-1,4-benzoquinol methylase